MRLLMAVALLTLAVCGGGAVPPSPSPPSAADRIITQADDGKTVGVRVGDVVQVALGDQFEWSLQISDPTVLAAEPGMNTLVRGTQLLARAKAAGTARIDGTGKPRCAPNQACIQIVATFRVTVVVR